MLKQGVGYLIKSKYGFDLQRIGYIFLTFHPKQGERATSMKGVTKSGSQSKEA